GPGPGGVVLGASATIGTISRVEGKTVYVKAPDGKETKVTLTAQTRIQKQVDGTAADLQPGANVTVRPEGQPGSDGSVTAASVSLLPEDGSVTFRGPGGQSATAGTRVGGR
ncbi:MAG TPA: hypothetical protein VHN78_14540, partial [Chloroflexota bacterium]|nr:hypothetical protein [Chloroflexota bacterium]